MPGADLFGAVKQAVPMPQLAEYYGYKVSRDGKIACPFHNEKTPSLKLYGGSRGWCCFGCGAGGSVIDFVARLFELSPLEAAKQINRDFALGLSTEKPDGNSVNRWRREKARMEREAAQKEALMRRNCDTYRLLRQELPRIVDGEARAAILAKLEYLDYWFLEVEMQENPICTESSKGGLGDDPRRGTRVSA